MNVEFKKGYDDWVDYWVRHGCTPTSSDCPARYMRLGESRSNYLKGWIAARNEFLDSN